MDLIELAKKTRPVDGAKARLVAVAVAAALGGRVAPNKKVVLGEPICPFGISMSVDTHRCRLLISEKQGMFKGDLIRQPAKIAAAAFYYACFKEANPVMMAGKPVPRLAKELGVPVFTMGFMNVDEVDRHLRAPRTWRALHALDLGPFVALGISPAQIRATFDMESPAKTAQTGLALRELFVGIYEDVLERLGGQAGAQT